MRFFAALALFVVVVLPASNAVADSHVEKSEAFIRSLADRALDNITNESLTPEQRSENFRLLFREGFAVEGIAKWVTGRYWRNATTTEREQYLVLFEDVVVGEWSDRLFSQYDGQRFEIVSGTDATPPNSQEKVALIKSNIYTDATTAIAIEWRVSSVGDLMKITDVKADGLSLAQTQRDDFTSHASKNGRRFSAIIAKLREKSDL
jgi:phospholipid transport system substrate-binding protein